VFIELFDVYKKTIFFRKNQKKIKKERDEAAESCTIDGESPVVKIHKNFGKSRVAWDTWNPV